MLQLVPESYLSHLVNNVLPPGEREAARERLATDRAGVLGQLEIAQPGLLSRISAMWPYYGRRSVFLWRVPKLVALGLPGLRTRLPATATGDVLVLDPPTTPERDRLHQLQFSTGSVRVTVRVTVPRVVRVDTAQGLQEIDSYQDVDVVVAPSRKLAETYTGQQYSRRALISLSKKVHGSAVPPDRSRRWTNEWLVPILFTEAQVNNYCTLRALEFVNVRGPDPAGELGCVEYDARVQNNVEVPFSNEARIQNQLQQDNNHRTYNHEVTHPDGYIERFKIRFTLGRNSHVTFVTKASVFAMERVIDEFVSQLP